MTNTIRPEAGKRYKTRDGMEVRIEVVDRKFAYADGYADDPELFWYANGKFTIARKDHPLDLVECIGEIK